MLMFRPYSYLAKNKLHSAAGKIAASRLMRMASWFLKSPIGTGQQDPLTLAQSRSENSYIQQNRRILSPRIEEIFRPFFYLYFFFSRRDGKERTATTPAISNAHLPAIIVNIHAE